MPKREGRVRWYAAGLVMETAPSYRCGPGLDTITKPLPGMLVRSPVQPHRTGAVVLQQAVALLTGMRVAVPSVTTAAGIWRQARKHLAGFGAKLVWEQETSALLAQCLGALSAGGLVLLQWQSQPLSNRYHPVRSPDPPSRWMLMVGVDGPWRVQGVHTPAESSALLVLDATVPPVWACGHNQHLKPGAQPDHAQASRAGLFRPVWTARTLDGGLEYGLLMAAVAIYPPVP